LYTKALPISQRQTSSRPALVQITIHNITVGECFRPQDMVALHF